MSFQPLPKITDLKQIDSANVVFITVIGMLLLSSCAPSTEPAQTAPSQLTPADDSASACIDVYGKVLGGVIPNSTAHLYNTDAVEYDDVMAKVKGDDWVQSTLVNGTKEFMFSCLDFGNYAIMIPTSSYNRSVGYPLPHEICTENLSIEIAFQGGDHQYAVGVFSVYRNNLTSPCEESVIWYREGMGKYIKRERICCVLGQEEFQP